MLQKKMESIYLEWWIFWLCCFFFVNISLHELYKNAILSASLSNFFFLSKFRIQKENISIIKKLQQKQQQNQEQQLNIEIILELLAFSWPRITTSAN